MAQEAAQSPHEILTTGERLRVLRKRRRMTLQQLADQTGLGRSSLSEYEGDKAIPSGEAIRVLALALGTSADYILRLKATPSKPSGKRTSVKRGTSGAAELPIANDLPRQASLLQPVK